MHVLNTFTLTSGRLKNDVALDQTKRGSLSFPGIKVNLFRTLGDDNSEKSAASLGTLQPVCQVAQWHTAIVCFARWLHEGGEEQITGEEELTKARWAIYKIVFGSKQTVAWEMEKNPEMWLILLHNETPEAAGREDTLLGSTEIIMKAFNDAFFVFFLHNLLLSVFRWEWKITGKIMLL